MTFFHLSSESNRYIFGLTHIPRLEDYPVMPVEHIGFMLMVKYRTKHHRRILFLQLHERESTVC